VPFAEVGNPNDRELLVTEVSRRRRDRLVKFIAQVIARDIVRSRGS
jgi:hypothetical protein